MRLDDLPTPALVLDRAVLARNCARMAAVARRHGVTLRPHLKTAKSAEVARLASEGGITVSTLAEAAYFARNGLLDMTYAVGIAPGKLDALDRLRRDHGARVTILIDGPDQVAAVAGRAEALDARFDVLIEIDTGGGRGGVAPEGPDLLTLAGRVAASPALSLTGVLAHAGHSYHARDLAEIRAIAEAERAGAVGAAARLRAVGHAAPVVSVGSTPTVLHAERLDGVTEVRPGVYTLFDLQQAALGGGTLDDIAATVLATVIGHNPRVGRALIDAGGLALSKDLSASALRDDAGYGLVRLAGEPAPLPGHRVDGVHQEHGLIAGPRGGPPDWDRLPIGARVRILPNHACMTAAPYDRFHVVDGGDAVVAVWDRATGW